MKYKVTSSEASKMLKKITDEKSMYQVYELQSSVFNATLGEEIESVRPAYDYAQSQTAIAACDEKIRAIKHAINCFNTTQTVGDTGMTIDQVLVYIPQLTERKNRLYGMQNRLPKQRVSVGGIGSNTVIDYRYTNYDVEQAKADYTAVSDQLANLQTALDLVNSTIVFEIELND